MCRPIEKKIWLREGRMGEGVGWAWELINCLKCLELVNMVKMSNANSQHKWIFVKYL